MRLSACIISLAFLLGDMGVVSFISRRLIGGRTALGNQLDSATSAQPADLTPAIDKYSSLPPLTPPVLPYFMTAKGPTPMGPDPFALVADELQPLSDYVLDLVKSENPVLTMAASHFFDQVSF